MCRLSDRVHGQFELIKDEKGLFSSEFIFFSFISKLNITIEICLKLIKKYIINAWTFFYYYVNAWT